MWCEEVIPLGCVHLPQSGTEDPAARAKVLTAVCKQLGIDYCRAMVGFERQNGRAVPKMDGIVICEEHTDIVREAAREKSACEMEKDYVKQRKSALKRWKELLVSLVVERNVKRTKY